VTRQEDLTASEVSRIAQELTAISSFKYEERTIERLLEVLQEQPLVSAASLWKIKRNTKTLCAKGRTNLPFNPDPMDVAFEDAFVCSYEGSVIGDIISRDAFRELRPYIIDDVNIHQDDAFFRAAIQKSGVALRKVIFLPLESYLLPPEDNPSYFLSIYISEESEQFIINSELLQAIANKTSSTLSSQIERNQNRITAFIKDITNKSPTLDAILPAFMADIVPQYFSYRHAVLLWQAPGSRHYECRYSSVFKISDFKQSELDDVAQICIDECFAVTVLLSRDKLHGRCEHITFSETAIVAPIKNQEAGGNPHGFILLLDKLSPLARRINPSAVITDRFDWEDEIMMKHATSMLGMVVGLLYADERRKQLADTLAHEMAMPANYIYSTSEELIEDYSHSSMPSSVRHKRLLTQVQSYAHLQLALSDGILLGLRDENTAPSRIYSPSHVDLFKIARDVVKIAYPVCEQHKVRNDKIRVFKTLPLLYVDQAAFTQVLLNLVTNAIKYSGATNFEDFSVTINCEPSSFGGIAPEITAKYFGPRYNPATPGDLEIGLRTGYLITIEDEGVGINPKFVDKIFQRHFRVPGIEKYSARGSGLGLSIVRRIVQDHFGAIWLERASKPTRFAIYLPAKITNSGYTKDAAWKGLQR
jgi:signal transduction histidine kinase